MWACLFTSTDNWDGSLAFYWVRLYTAGSYLFIALVFIFIFVIFRFGRLYDLALCKTPLYHQMHTAKGKIVVNMQDKQEKGQKLS